MYKGILACVDCGENSAKRILLAARLTSRNEARFAGLHVAPKPGLPTTMRASFAFAALMQSNMEAMRNKPRNREHAFTDAGNLGISPAWRTEELHHTEMSTLAAPAMGDRRGTPMAQTGAEGTPGAACHASPASGRFPRRRQAGAPDPRSGP